MTIETTAIYIAILTLLTLPLGIRVSVLRAKYKLSVGDGDHLDLRKAVRVFGNFIEWVPITLIALGAAETLGAPSLFIHIVGIGLLVGRLAHIVGLDPVKASAPLRGVGATLTWLAVLASGGYTLYAVIV